jgi:hypothetical protein
MAKYGDFKYTSTTLYGSGSAVSMPDANSECTWILLVDWNNDGTYEGVNEAQWLHELVSFRRGRDHYVAQGGNDFERMQMGKAILRMDNSDRRYDPYNASSPLYPNVVPGRRAQLSVRYNSTGESFVLMTGFIENIRPVNDDRKNMYIDLVDGWKLLTEGDIGVDTPIYRTTISNCIHSVLDDSDYSGGRSIDTDTQPIVRWAPDQENAARTLQKLATASLGNVFVNKHGRFCFFSRSHNSQHTHTLDQTDTLKNILVSMPWENVRNEVTCIANKPFKGELKSILALPSPFKIELPSTTWRTFTLELDREYIDVTFEGLQANTKADNSGIWITNVIDYTYSLTTKSITISVATPINGYITSVDLKGREYVTRAVKFNASDTNSRAAYGNRRFILDSEYLQNINHAEAFAKIIKNELKDPSKAPKIIIQGRPDIQFDFDLLDKVAFTSTTLGIMNTFYIGSIELRWLKEGGQSVQTILTLTPLIYDTTSISDDPYDPGLPEVPTLPGDGSGSGFPEPIDVPVDCIADPNAAPNGPFSIFSGSKDLISSPTVQKYYIFPVSTVVRMASSTYPTTVTIRSRRTIWVAGKWYMTEATGFYEIWAVDSTGAELFQASEVVTSGEWITAKFAPAVGTVIGGIKVKTIVSPEFNFNIGHTFDFSGGPEGWICAPQNLATYPVGSPYGPASYRSPFAPANWSYYGRLGVNADPLEQIGFDVHNLWCYFPNFPVYGQAGAYIKGYVDHGGNAWIGFGTLYTDGTWEYAGTIGDAWLTKSCGAGNYGKQVRCWQFDVNSMWNKWQYLDNVEIKGWDLNPTSTMQLTIYDVYISNICEV